jgi:hypothetical protein
MMGWYVEYHDVRDKIERVIQSSHYDTRKQAVDAACELLRQHHRVKRAVGPNGEVVTRAEIERRCAELRAAGKL